MEKRTRTDSDDYEYIARKFSKLERMLLRARRKHRDRQQGSATSPPPSSSSSRSKSDSSLREIKPCPPPEPSNSEDVPSDKHGYVMGPHVADNAAAPAPMPVRTAMSARPSTGADAAPQSSSGHEVTDSSALLALNVLPVDVSDATDLAGDLLKILGNDPSQASVYGKDIRVDLAARLQNIATTGLPKEIRNELLEKYLPPANSVLIGAPNLNPEVKAAVHDQVFERDKDIEMRQKQLASAISGVAEALTLLMSEQPLNTKLIQLLMDSCKILCDGQNAESLLRRNFILHYLKKEFKDELQATKIDKLLFSQELADTLKAGKAIAISGDDLKAVPSTSGVQLNKVTSKNLNWRGPPQTYYRPSGTQRTKEPSQKSRPVISSGTSSRPHHTHRSRR